MSMRPPLRSARLLLLVLAMGCRRDSPHLGQQPPAARTTPIESSSGAAPSPHSPIRFTLVTPESGIDFHYHGGPTPQARMTEQNGGGIAVLDFDRDGTCDLFFTNGSDGKSPPQGLADSQRLYRGGNALRFADATASAGLMAHGFGMGATAGDYDNDGFTDLFVACYGPDRLWHNNGDGTFTEVADFVGGHSDRWGTSAAFADLDADGLLDLYVVNYVEWSFEDPPCHQPGHPQINTICSPMERKGHPDELYRNAGDGRFEDVGVAAGIAHPDGKGLALAVADFDNDRRLDVYVVNDTSRNFLFLNQGDVRFEDFAVFWGVAISGDGTVGSGMGAGCADFDHNGWLDLCVTNFRNQVNDVFANHGEAGFVAVNTQLGVDAVSRTPLGFGIVLADFDNDTWPDMFVANGHIWDLESLGPEYEYRMTPQVLRNVEGRQFLDVSSAAGEYFRKKWLGRALALGDLDNDGDLDVIVSQLDDPPAILRNDSETRGPGMRCEFIGTRAARQPLGATVTIVSGGKPLTTQVPAGGSFQSSHDPRVLVSLPQEGTVDEVQIAWPGGEVEFWRPQIEAEGTLRLREGTGQRRP